MGMSVVDCFCLAKFHNFLPQGRICNIDYGDMDDINRSDEVSMKTFAGILSTQLLYKAYNVGNEVTIDDEERLIEPLGNLMNSKENCDSTGRDGLNNAINESRLLRGARTEDEIGAGYPDNPYPYSVPRFIGDGLNSTSRIYQDLSSVSVHSAHRARRNGMI